MTVFVLFPILMALSALAQGKVKFEIIVFTCENEWRIDFVTLEKFRISPSFDDNNNPALGP